MILKWKASSIQRIRYWPLIVLMPALDAAGKTVKQNMAVRDTLLVTIALEAYRREHGAYPDELSTLVPRYLPAPPVDHSTGKPLLYKLVDGKPLLYGRGIDGDDDGGVPGRTQSGLRRWPYVARSGDWVLYPVPRKHEEGDLED